jgi:CHASE3 domain sensor protein
LRLAQASTGDGAASCLWVIAVGIFLGLFLILSAIIWNGERASSDRRKAELREVRTQTILLEAQHLLSVLQDTEAAQRDYVITRGLIFSSPTTRDARRSGYLSIA